MSGPDRRPPRSAAGGGKRRHPVRITDYGVIGNLETVALVAPDGSIDWCCLPRFASPSVFGRLLDPDRGGYLQIAPVEAYRSTASYLPMTNVLATRFTVSRGRALTVTDLMPVDPQGQARAPGFLVRRMESSGGTVTARIEVQPKFGYGASAPRWKIDGRSAVAIAGRDRAWMGFPAPPARRARGVELRVPISPGEPRTFELAWGGARPRLTEAPELIEETVEFWQGWTHSQRALFHRRATARHPWVERSELALKVLSSGDAGPFVAAATTSLPEWPGGPRNWDYRFAWVRDSAFTAEALLMLGHIPEARRFLRWTVGHGSDGSAAGLLRVLYPAHPEDSVEERELPRLRGYLGSRPVRVGNAAHEQFQLDIYGELMDAAVTLFLLDRDSVEVLWPSLERTAARAEQLWRHPDGGIWEARGPPAHYVYSKVMAWVAFDRARSLSREFQGTASALRWERLADHVRDEVLLRGYDPRRRSFLRAYDQAVSDAANLRIPLVGFLPADDPRVVDTVHRIELELGPPPFLRRYTVEDGLEGPEGCFLACGFWLVECLSRQGERRRAAEYFDRLTQAAGPLRLFSEEFDPASGLPLGNYPQALTHIAVLRAALALGHS